LEVKIGKDNLLGCGKENPMTSVFASIVIADILVAAREK